MLVNTIFRSGLVLLVYRWYERRRLNRELAQIQALDNSDEVLDAE